MYMTKEQFSVPMHYFSLLPTRVLLYRNNTMTSNGGASSGFHCRMTLYVPLQRVSVYLNYTMGLAQ